MKHVRNTNANIEPVFLAYKSSQPLIDLIDRIAKETPVYDFVAPIDHFRHQFWVIADPKDKEVITTEFDKMDALYIADGTHVWYDMRVHLSVLFWKSSLFPHTSTESFFDSSSM